MNDYPEFMDDVMKVLAVISVCCTTFYVIFNVLAARDALEQRIEQLEAEQPVAGNGEQDE